MKTINISGMSCGHCSGAVTKALSAIEGITDVKVDLENKQATFTETQPVSMELIKAAITKIGFEVV